MLETCVKLGETIERSCYTARNVRHEYSSNSLALETTEVLHVYIAASRSNTLTSRHIEILLVESAPCQAQEVMPPALYQATG